MRRGGKMPEIVMEGGGNNGKVVYKVMFPEDLGLENMSESDSADSDENDNVINRVAKSSRGKGPDGEAGPEGERRRARAMACTSND